MCTLTFMSIRHDPVMTKEVFASLPSGRTTYVDGTFGHGGHVEYIMEELKKTDPTSIKNKRIVAIDRDEKMLTKGKDLLAPYHAQIDFVHNSYGHIEDILKEELIQKVDYILLDLGVNMEHFKDPERGFSFLYDAPLDMRFDQTSGQTAAKVVNTYPRTRLADIFVKYGDFSEKSSLYIADALIEKRSEGHILTTHELNDTLRKKGLRKEQMPVIFQCLRIETNHELDELIHFLEVFPPLLSSGGRCAIMTYHSIEDRLVKLAFKDMIERDPSLTLYNKKVIAPNYKEVMHNRAARSAKMRIIEHA